MKQDSYEYISGKTGVYGIIGNPVEHSISPAMHNAAFRELGIDSVYVPFRVRKEDLAAAVKGLKAVNVRGINVTIPHKVDIIPWLDEIDSFAAKIGAVNTVVNRDGFLKGYNTDAEGFLRALEANRISPAGKKVLIIGAGGAARSVTFILADRGSELTIVNRHSEAAVELAEWVFASFRHSTSAFALEDARLKEIVRDADILINTTSVGMDPQPDSTPVPASFLKPGLVVFDIVYSPLRTRLLRDAEKIGAVTIGGIEMLVRQGAAAFELWTGEKAPVDVMREAAVGAMQG